MHEPGHAPRLRVVAGAASRPSPFGGAALAVRAISPHPFPAATRDALSIGISTPFNVGERTFNVGERTFNVGERTFNVGERMFNGGEPTFTVGEPTFNVGERMFNGGEPTFTVGERTFNVGERTFNVGERTFNVGERTFNVGERTFTVGERTFTVGERTFNVGEPTLNVGERMFNGGERTFNVGERTFTVGERTVIVGERTVIVGERTVIVGERTVIVCEPTAQPRFGPVPAYRPLTLAGASVGRTYQLAGRADEAIDELQRAARSCVALDHPFEHTRTNLWLGMALEAKGDKEGACTAYGVVLSRWGRTKPRAVTARRAAERAATLGCPP